MSHNKHIRGDNNQYNDIKTFQYLKYGEVLSVDDPSSLGRIKVWIKGSISNGGDDEIKNDISQLPWCYPLLPKHISIQPKVGEGVWIFVFNKQKEHSDRMFIGPIVSQLNKLDFDSARTTGLAGLTFGPTLPTVNITNGSNGVAIPELVGVFPNPEDISIQGRYNTDITQKTNEIVIRAGKFIETPILDAAKNPYPFVFNTATQGFIQIKNNATILTTNDDPTLVSNKTGTITNIVSNKINLITHGGSPKFNVTNQENLISDDEMQKILSNAHQVGFGDIQLQYLILLKEAFINHVHNGHGNKPTDLTLDGNKQALKVFLDKAKELEDSMLSKNIRIN